MTGDQYQVPEGVERLTPVMDKLLSGDTIVRMQSSGAFGRYIDEADLPAIKQHWEAEQREEVKERIALVERLTASAEQLERELEQECTLRLAEAVRAEKAEKAYREINAKLESGYSFCHPENDCEGRRGWLKAQTSANAAEKALADLTQRAAGDLPPVLAPLKATPQLAAVVNAAIEVARDEGHDAAPS